ncbi:MAG: molybdenum cofactor guanylyltransferase [Terriglobales bacterium]
MHIAILAGGQSRRMGRDKALLPWRGQPLLAHMIQTARAAGAATVIISGAPEKYAAFGPCLRDEWEAAGPLGGIATVLRAAAADRVLMLACDLPEMTPGFLGWLWAQSGPGAWTVPLTPPEQLEPLCAVYAASLLPLLEAALATGEAKIARALAAAPQRRLSAAALAAAGFAPDIFRNCNTPADL